VEHFLAKHGAPGHPVDPAVLDFFMRYAWPGNVRELEHALEAALQMANGPALRMADLPLHLQRAAGRGGLVSEAVQGGAAPASGVWLEATDQGGATGQLLRSAVKDLEREAIQQALRAAKGNLSQAAAILGLPRQTLQYRVKKLGLR
jgi:arginine utilization regulatory protein